MKDSKGQLQAPRRNSLASKVERQKTLWSTEGTISESMFVSVAPLPSAVQDTKKAPRSFYCSTELRFGRPKLPAGGFEDSIFSSTR